MITDLKLPAALVLLAVLSLLGATLFALNAAALVPVGGWIDAALAAPPDATRALMFRFSFLPRVAMALLVGAALALAGAILQRALRNQLAEPATLGISAGAHLALAIATVWFPGALVLGREGVALIGAGLALAAVMALSWRRALSPVTVILSGLLVSLYCGAFAAIITLFNHDLLIGLFFWGAGNLGQQDWAQVNFLAPRLLVVALASGLIIRPLTLLGLEDEGARSLGLSVAGARIAALVIAVVAIGFTTAAAGVFGFVGLAGPALVRSLGVRRTGLYLLLSTLVGAFLLLTTDQLIQLLPTTYRLFPTGAATALLGAPLLLYLLPRLRASCAPPTATSLPSARRARPGIVLAVATLILAAIFIATLVVGHDGTHWAASSVNQMQGAIDWRLPRSLAALCAGAILAMAGCILQRGTGNPMASPEILGISSGAMLGVIVLMFSTATASRSMQIAAGGAGALAVLLFMIALSRRSGFSGDRLLLTGVALSSATGLIMAVLMTAQDPRLGQLLSWVAGSTYHATMAEAGFTATVCLLALAGSPLIFRWLDLMPLGQVTIFSLGVPVAMMRYLLFALTAILTATATIVIGPLSFVGLMGPHIARMLGFHRAREQLLAAALCGGAILLIADWLGRNLIFPFQIPAGLATTVLGGPFMLWLIARRRS
ncbi:Fe(3+)-hydroxamate ABC transporter permease FhuB [Radicibacter daui]|uniref:Fe(3+)-hydroxamate ABC transporter permease FhuB n=1 Tax=Radicibacter daui TaxID=3064829 RepID=UPI004046D758